MVVNKSKVMIWTVGDIVGDVGASEGDDVGDIVDLEGDLVGLGVGAFDGKRVVDDVGIMVDGGAAVIVGVCEGLCVGDLDGKGVFDLVLVSPSFSCSCSSS